MHRLKLERLSKFRHSALLILLLGMVTTSVLYFFVAKIEFQAHQSRFNIAAARYVVALEKGATDSMGALRAIRLHFVDIPNPTQKQFREFVTPLLSRDAHINALFYVPLVSDADRRAAEHVFTQEGYSGGFKDYTPDGKLINAKKHAQYAVIRYAEPLNQNADLRGYNILSRPGFPALFEQAMNSGDLVLTPAVRLIQDLSLNNPRLALVAYLPLYRKHWLPKTPFERRANIFGYAAATLHCDTLFGRILGKAGYQEKDGIAMQINDDGQTDLGTPIFSVGTASASTALAPLARKIHVAGRTWAVTVSATKDFPEVGRLSSRTILLSGILLSILLACLFRALNQYTQKIERQVQDRTTELTLAQQTLEEKNHLNEALLRAQSEMGDGLMIIQDLKLTYANAHLLQMLGQTKEELFALPQFIEIFSPDERPIVMQRHLRRLTGDKFEQMYETQLITKDGTILEINLAAVLAEWHSQQSVVVEVRDISEAKRAQAKLLYLAHYDSLTDLPNRALLKDRLSQAIALARRHTRFLGVLYLDLDRFKHINDAYGHDAGDQLLKIVALRLQECVRQTDTVARLGGDEFVILLPDQRGIEDAIAVAKKIIASMQVPVKLADGEEITTSASVGICVHSPDDQSPDELLKCADNAMYLAKQKGRNTYHLG